VVGDVQSSTDVATSVSHLFGWAFPMLWPCWETT
jgi:hypothetical protein